MEKQKLAVDIARSILKMYSTGDKILTRHKRQLFTAVATEGITKYKWLVTKDPADCNMVVRYHTFYNKRRVRCICVKSSSSGQYIPITLKSLSQGLVDTRQDKLKALRNAIQYQIADFRKQHKKKLAVAMKEGNQETIKELTHCPYTGKPLLVGQIHVHHASTPFVDLVQLWCKGAGIALEDLSTHGVTGLRNKKLENSWKEFHELNAVLKVVSAEYNLFQGSRKESPQ